MFDNVNLYGGFDETRDNEAVHNKGHIKLVVIYEFWNQVNRLPK